jgi:hypothetical protein
MPDADRIDPWRWGLAIGGVLNLANALWMLLDPAGWYAGLPAAVPDTGPLNEHFVRDIGSEFAVMGAGMLLAGIRPALRVPLLAFVGLFYVLHALVHVTDTVAGRLPPSHWGIDVPGVYAPAVVIVLLTLLAARSVRA